MVFSLMLSITFKCLQRRWFHYDIIVFYCCTVLDAFMCSMSLMKYKQPEQQSEQTGQYFLTMTLSYHITFYNVCFQMHDRILCFICIRYMMKHCTCTLNSIKFNEQHAPFNSNREIEIAHLYIKMHALYTKSLHEYKRVHAVLED
jgi:hypothetical protein